MIQIPFNQQVGPSVKNEDRRGRVQKTESILNLGMTQRPQTSRFKIERPVQMMKSRLHRLKREIERIETQAFDV